MLRWARCPRCKLWSCLDWRGGLATFASIEDVLGWCDPYPERVWEEVSDADETKLLISHDFKEGTVGWRLAHLTRAELNARWAEKGDLPVSERAPFTQRNLLKAAVESKYYRYVLRPTYCQAWIATKGDLLYTFDTRIPKWKSRFRSLYKIGGIMSKSLRMGWRASCALLLAGAAPRRANVTYIFTATGTGTLNGAAFSGSFTVTEVADTSGITSGGGEFRNTPTSATLTAGALTASLSNPLIIDNTAPGGFIGFAEGPAPSQTNP